MAAERLVDHALAHVGQRDQFAAAVVGIGATLYELGAFEAVEPGGHAARRNHQRFVEPVSYTHLDVYKRQALSRSCSAGVSEDKMRCSFATWRPSVSSITRLPTSVSAISLPRRSLGSGRRSMSLARSRRSSRAVMPPDEIISAS